MSQDVTYKQVSAGARAKAWCLLIHPVVSLFLCEQGSTMR
jgi:hypothetical protein